MSDIYLSCAKLLTNCRRVEWAYGPEKTLFLTKYLKFFSYAYIRRARNIPVIGISRFVIFLRHFLAFYSRKLDYENSIMKIIQKNAKIYVCLILINSSSFPSSPSKLFWFPLCLTPKCLPITLHQSSYSSYFVPQFRMLLRHNTESVKWMVVREIWSRQISN